MHNFTFKSRRLVAAASLCLGLLVAGCGSEDETGTGSLTVLLESEDTITEGIEFGDAGATVRDGWDVAFDKFIVTVGDVDVHFATDESVEAEAEELFVVDLTKVPGGGLPLWTLEGLREGRWEFNYWTSGAAHDAKRHSSVVTADFNDMVDNDWTYLIDGTLLKAEGQSCPPAALATPRGKEPNGKTSGGNDCYDAPSVRFTFGATAETSFGPCEIDEVPGFAISAGRTQTVAATIHGDHLFFNGFPEGNEGGVARYAQWLADCDLNLDGTVTAEELAAIAPSQLPEIDDRFQLGGSPITPLENMYDYAISQLKTQGHFQGEGECPFDGKEHEHGDDE